jgi:gluconate 2-dehydrogenase alpha chain
LATRLKQTDVVFVGLGAAGGLAAMPLTQAGLEVVGLEAGPRLSTDDYVADEVRQSRNWMGNAKANQEVPTHRFNSRVAETRPRGTVGPMMNAVGGTSIHWGTQAWRFHPWNFHVRSESIKRWGAGVIPAGSTIQDWPLTYDELEPYYDKVEYLHGISGKAGNIRGKLDPRGNIFEGPRQREFPLPPMRMTGVNQLMSDAAKRLGWHPFPTPAGIRSQPYKGLAGCEYHGWCGGGCHVGAKAGSQLNGIPEAEKTGKLKVVPGAWVTRVEVDKEGRASGVTFVKSGREYFQPAKVVMLSAFTFENVRLLLLSKSDAYPNGLSNNHGQVGKHFISPGGTDVVGLIPGKKLNQWYGTGGQQIVCDDFEGDAYDSKGEFISYSSLRNGGAGSTPISAARGTPPNIPLWGSAWKDWVRKYADNVVAAGAHVDFLTYEENFLDLDPNVKDPMGNPVIRITYDTKPHEQRAWDFYKQKAVLWLKESGVEQIWEGRGLPRLRAVHSAGGARMGDDPEQNVTDRWAFSHEVPNLGVLGGGTFPTASGRNPTLTVWAMAWRTADHMTKNWKSITT